MEWTSIMGQHRHKENHVSVREKGNFGKIFLRNLQR
jgi:hypothetical protein